MANKAEKKDNICVEIPEDVSPHTIIMVHNGFYGRLTYVSRKTGEEYNWEEFDDVLEMELGELRTAKGSQRAFFENNWFMFEDKDAWVPEYLGVGSLYKNSLSRKELETLFTKTPNEVKKLIEKAPEGQKQSIAYKARELYNNDEIDSLKMVSVLENALDIRLRF